MKSRFGGIERLYGQVGANKIEQAHVAIVGVGGVGCWSAEILARSGVGTISLIDADELCLTNINRQIHALDSTIGQGKTKVMAARIKDINPDCKVRQINAFFMESNKEVILSANFDHMIDAIDSVKHKVLLLSECLKRKIPVITVGGAGGKTDPARIQSADLAKTYGDRLIKKVRQQLRKDYGFSTSKKMGITAVFSDEEMLMPACGTSSKSLKLDCDTGYGTSPAVISIFGIRAAELAIQQLTKSNPNTS
ncbi:MAG: tRNA threonylcarbamoyladenosine dehydratase [Proteobacteria bacterium]|nr:tRNA threonylcarbamoyladenosine dehydratase [Pseudomonadota bacterium]